MNLKGTSIKIFLYYTYTIFFAIYEVKSKLVNSRTFWWGTGMFILTNFSSVKPLKVE